MGEVAPAFRWTATWKRGRAGQPDHLTSAADTGPAQWPGVL